MNLSRCVEKPQARVKLDKDCRLNNLPKSQTANARQ